MADPFFSMGPSGDLTYPDASGKIHFLTSVDAAGAALEPVMAPAVNGGASRQLVVFAVSITPAATNANTSAEQTFNTYTGILTTDTVLGVQAPAAPTAGLSGPTNLRISANDTVRMTWGNHTAGALTAPAGVYTVTVLR